MSDLQYHMRLVESLRAENQIASLKEIEYIETIERLQRKLSIAIDVGALMISRFENVSKREATTLMISRVGGINV